MLPTLTMKQKVQAVTDIPRNVQILVTIAALILVMSALTLAIVSTDVAKGKR